VTDALDLDLDTAPVAPKPERDQARLAPHAKGDAHAHGEGACLNCGTPLTGEFCHACGQSAHVHRSAAHVLEEMLHGVAHLDSRMWRSLPRLAFRPGTMTREYVMGRRARYLPPFAMFLFSVFAMFIIFAFTGGPGFVPNQVEAGATTNLTPAERQAALEELRVKREQARKDGERIEQAALGAAETLVEASPKSGEAGEGADNAFMTVIKEQMRKGDFVATPWPALNKKLRAKMSNPDLFFYKIQNTAYKFSFLLIPISLPFIWLMLFWKRGVTIYDHAVFALYSVSFMSLLFLGVALLSRWLPWNDVSWALVAAPPVHLFFQFKGAYELGWFSALWRTALFCGLLAWVILGLFLVAIIALGLTG
jgi:hypothetical protein